MEKQVQIMTYSRHIGSHFQIEYSQSLIQ